MRQMSFMLTQAQMQARTKTVTRRLGWDSLQPGQRIRAVVKGMGLKKGEKVEEIGVIRVVSVRKEPLSKMLYDAAYGAEEAAKEGFSGMTGHQFVAMFCEHMACEPRRRVTRIEFEHITESSG